MEGSDGSLGGEGRDRVRMDAERNLRHWEPDWNGTTGAWYMLKGKYGKRQGDVPLWFRVLERFGLPTLLALVLMAVLGRMIENDREDRKTANAAMATAIKEQATTLAGAIREQATAIKDLGEQVEENTRADAVNRAVDRATGKGSRR